MERREFIRSLFVFPLIGLQAGKSGREPGPVVLLDTVVSGFQYYQGEKVWSRLKEGRHLRLVRERNNPYDEKAVEVYRQNEKLGYIPRIDNSVISQLMDRGAGLKATIDRLQRSNDPWERIGVQILMGSAG